MNAYPDSLAFTAKKKSVDRFVGPTWWLCVRTLAWSSNRQAAGDGWILGFSQSEGAAEPTYGRHRRAHWMGATLLGGHLSSPQRSSFLTS